MEWGVRGEREPGWKMVYLVIFLTVGMETRVYIP
ncbi:hypothetical protein T4B_11449 [Trichinella pseudospiralis]|uniref:Uncharacterized protein n=1 Tax=Trichinella pseudospiralis TaxID=6337 RepID=A0A0V1G9L4_TRIPS|nr:hypothetical protein T4B_11449 [Trichinella pseudospiralis]